MLPGEMTDANCYLGRILNPLGNKPTVERAIWFRLASSKGLSWSDSLRCYYSSKEKTAASLGLSPHLHKKWEVTWAWISICHSFSLLWIQSEQLVTSQGPAARTLSVLIDCSLKLWTKIIPLSFKFPLSATLSQNQINSLRHTNLSVKV